MDKPYAPPNILRLAGITLADYTSVEDVADERLLDQCGASAVGSDDAADEASYPPDRIPHRFTTLAEWPHNTNLRCWQCNFTFDDRPKFVPTYVRESERGGVDIGVRGNFCTFNCAELWIEIEYAGQLDQQWRAQDALCIVYFLFTGHRVSRILPAPRHTRMRQYGDGDWSEETFWTVLRSLDPIAGLRDHTPGTVVPERNRATLLPERAKGAPVPMDLRPGVALDLLRASSGDLVGVGAPKRGLPGSVWAACGAEPPEAEPPRAEPETAPARGGPRKGGAEDKGPKGKDIKEKGKGPKSEGPKGKGPKGKDPESKDPEGKDLGSDLSDSVSIDEYRRGARAPRAAPRPTKATPAALASHVPAEPDAVDDQSWLVASGGETSSDEGESEEKGARKGPGHAAVLEPLLPEYPESSGEDSFLTDEDIEDILDF